MQNRKPPAYQEYAATMLANHAFRQLGLAGRGLLYTLRLEYWANGELPENPEPLAAILRLDVEEVKQILPSLRKFLRGDESEIVFPDLEDYRVHLDERRKKQSEGGKRGANKTNRKRNDDISVSPTSSSGYPQDTCKEADGALVQNSLVEVRIGQQSQTQPINIQTRPLKGGEDGDASLDF